MRETSNSQQRGFLLISSLMVLSIMIIIVSFYLSAILQETRVAQIVNAAGQAYYLAEAGVHEALWKIENDTAWKNNFENDPDWVGTFSRADVPLVGGSYTVTLENRGTGDAVITATSTVAVRDATSQRVVRLNLFKPLNNNPINQTSLFADKDIESTGAELTTLSGDVFTNEDVALEYFSSWNIANNVRAVGNVAVSVSSSLTAANIKDQNSNPPPNPIQLFTIDFNTGESTSYKARASQMYTEAAFKTLLEDFPTTTLSGITYVTGNAHIPGGVTLTVNGALVAEGSITIGSGYGDETLPTVVDVNKTPEEPSGLLAKGNIVIGGFAANVDVEGLVYAGGRVRVQDGLNQDVDLNVVGGVFAQHVEFYNVWDPLTITHNQSNINEARPVSAHSSTVTVNYWEEEY